MANNVINWAYRIRHISPVMKFVLITLADETNKLGGGCFLFQGTVAESCNLSLRHTRRILADLERSGLITSAQRFSKDGSYSSKDYQLNIGVDPDVWMPPAMAPVSQIEAAAARLSWLDLINRRLGDSQTFTTWFLPLHIVSIEKKRLIVRVPNASFKDHLQSKFLPLLLDTAHESISSGLTKIHLIF